MKNNTLVIEDFLDFDKEFVRYIKNTEVLKSVKKVHFLIYNKTFSQIKYYYNHNSDEEFDMYKINRIFSYANSIVEKDYYNVMKSSLNMGGERNEYIVNLLNNFSTTKYVVGSMVFCCDSEISEQDISSSSININYLQQLMFYIVNVIDGYDKLYSMVDIFTELIAAKDQYMPYHMTNVAHLCLNLSNYLNIKPFDRILLYYSALLHDIGKLFIPDSIVNKEGRLTDDEFDRIKTHSNKSAEITNDIFHDMPILNEISEIIRHHHEDYNGEGYPDGLSGDDIPFLSRVLRVADTVDAMSSRRAYKKRESLSKIIDELTDCKGKQFDPRIADAMIKLLFEDSKEFHKGQIKQNTFIPQTSLSFQYGVKGELKSLVGNLIIKKGVVTFVSHDVDKKEYKFRLMLKSTISYMEYEDVIEHHVKVVEVKDGTYILEELQELPTDIVFSMIWNSEGVLFNKSTNTYRKVDIIKLGGNTVVLSLNLEDGEKVIKEIKDSLQIILTEKVEELKANLAINIRFVKFYKKDYRYIFIGKFINILPNQQDKVMRLLFKKQTLVKKNKLEVKIKR